MLIGIDGNEANIQNRVGSNIYAFEVLWHLYKLNVKDTFSIYLRSKRLSDLPPERENWYYKVFGPQKFWTQFALPVKLYLEKEKPEIFFTPGHYAPRFCPCPSVISILDTSYLLFPDYFRKQDLYQLKSWSAYSIKQAKKIFTISESSKHDLIKYYQLDENRIKVIYPGFDKERFNPNLNEVKTEEIAQKYGLINPYILFVGTLQPRKNVIRLVEAFEKLAISNQQLANYELVIVGKRGWIYDETIKRVNSSSKKDKIKLIGYIEDYDLPYLYKKASCFVLPSLYEGFGIPVAEAMSVGTPVVISDNSSLPEVAGKAGILINPNDITSINSGLEKALTLNPKEKEDIISIGLNQVKKFSWEKSAEQIYNELTH